MEKLEKRRKINTKQAKLNRLFSMVNKMSELVCFKVN